MEMTSGEILGLLAVGLTGILFVYVAFKNFSATGSANFTEAVATLQEMSAVAETVVMAAEQLWTTGKLPKDERFNYAFDLLQAEFPAANEEHIRAALEAAVFWLKAGLATQEKGE